MKYALIHLLALLLIPFSSAFPQKKLKKSDRAIVNNVQTHVAFLNGEKLAGRRAGTDGEKLADEYIAKQFAKAGLKPLGGNDWLQTFTIYDGKEIQPASTLRINDDELKLYKDFFPFAFSANKGTEAAVAIALAENGVPWFKDIKELFNDDDTTKADTLQAIRTKAKNAAAKGASALIIYSKSPGSDIQYNRFDQSEPVEIPVLYVTANAFNKYASDESAIIDVKLNVQLEKRSRTGNNVIGFSDNGSDSIVIATANLENETDVAALMEVARQVRNTKSKSKNYLFIAYCGEKNGKAGEEYFNEHSSVKKEQISNVISLDSIARTVGNPKALNLVKRSVELIKQ